MTGWLKRLIARTNIRRFVRVSSASLAVCSVMIAATALSAAKAGQLSVATDQAHRFLSAGRHHRCAVAEPRHRAWQGGRAVGRRRKQAGRRHADRDLGCKNLARRRLYDSFPAREFGQQSVFLQAAGIRAFGFLRDQHVGTDQLRIDRFDPVSLSVGSGPHHLWKGQSGEAELLVCWRRRGGDDQRQDEGSRASNGPRSTTREVRKQRRR